MAQRITCCTKSVSINGITRKLSQRIPLFDYTEEKVLQKTGHENECSSLPWNHATNYQKALMGVADLC